jgi:hypothetical protein
MTYERPEITLLGEASNLIQDFTKQTPGAIEAFDRRALQPSYDLDD